MLLKAMLVLRILRDQSQGHNLLRSNLNQEETLLVLGLTRQLMSINKILQPKWKEFREKKRIFTFMTTNLKKIFSRFSRFLMKI